MHIFFLNKVVGDFGDEFFFFLTENFLNDVIFADDSFHRVKLDVRDFAFAGISEHGLLWEFQMGDAG